MEQYGYAARMPSPVTMSLFLLIIASLLPRHPAARTNFGQKRSLSVPGEASRYRFSCASIARCGDAPRSIVPALLAWGNQVAESGELVELDILIEKEIPQLLSVKIGRNEPLSRDFLDVGGVV